MLHEATASGQKSPGRAEVESFQRNLGPFVVAAETTRMPMIFTDAVQDGNPIIFANDSFLRLTGYERAAVLGRGFRSLLAPEPEAGAPRSIDGQFGERPDSSEICYRQQDGSVAWASLFINPVRDDEGHVVQHFVSLVDLTKERREQRRLRLLLDELNHRTLNTLVTVLGIAGQTLSGATDEEAFDLFEARILALAKTHSLLSAENWVGVALGSIVDQIMLPFEGKDGQPRRFSVDGTEVRLQPKAALTLAMVIQELATNAVKHGALSGDAGTIEIAWQVQAKPGGSQLELRWEERGGPPVKLTGHKGFGSRLMAEGLAQELNGTVQLDYPRAGAVCRIEMPLVSPGGAA